MAFTLTMVSRWTLLENAYDRRTERIICEICADLHAAHSIDEIFNFMNSLARFRSLQRTFTCFRSRIQVCLEATYAVQVSIDRAARSVVQFPLLGSESDSIGNSRRLSLAYFAGAVTRFYRGACSIRLNYRHDKFVILLFACVSIGYSAPFLKLGLSALFNAWNQRKLNLEQT